jgi:hypothetical protein
MMIDHEFVGIKFEWQGITREPWVSGAGGLDCAGLTDYYHQLMRGVSMPLPLISNDGWSRVTMPKKYVLLKALAFNHLVTELEPINMGQATTIIYQGFDARMCLAAISKVRPDTALVFGADMRSQWVAIDKLDDVSYWRLNNATV